MPDWLVPDWQRDHYVREMQARAVSRHDSIHRMPAVCIGHRSTDDGGFRVQPVPSGAVRDWSGVDRMRRVRRRTLWANSGEQHLHAMQFGNIPQLHRQQQPGPVRWVPGRGVHLRCGAIHLLEMLARHVCIQHWMAHLPAVHAGHVSERHRKVSLHCMHGRQDQHSHRHDYRGRVRGLFTRGVLCHKWLFQLHQLPDRGVF